MRKIHIVMCMCFIVFVVTGCNQQSDRIPLYKTVFDSLLENDNHVEDVDYISLFVQSDDVTRDDFSKIEAYIRETYQKDAYSYTTAELKDSGAYGKENLNEEGIYLYITKLDDSDHHVTVHSEKYYTLESIEPIGMEMHFEEADEEWLPEEMTVEWEGRP